MQRMEGNGARRQKAEDDKEIEEKGRMGDGCFCLKEHREKPRQCKSKGRILLAVKANSIYREASCICKKLIFIVEFRVKIKRKKLMMTIMIYVYRGPYMDTDTLCSIDKAIASFITN